MLGLVRAFSVLLVAFVLGAPVHADQIRIGIPAPLTGTFSALGQDMRRGAELAVAEINAAGGVLGLDLGILVEDSGCRPARAVTIADSFILRGNVDILMGDLCSAATLAIMPIAERERVPLLVTISTHPDITNNAGKGGNDWVFRTNPTDEMIARAVADQLVQSGYKTVAYLAENTAYGRGGIAGVRRHLAGRAKVVEPVFVDPDTTDFVPVLTRLRDQEPQAILLYLKGLSLLELMKQYADLGLTPPLVGRPDFTSDLVRDLLSTGRFEGSWTLQPYDQSYGGEGNRSFVAAYRQKHNKAPDIVAFAMYEGVRLAAEAIERAGTRDPAAVRGALAASSFDSPIGTIVFDAHHQARPRLLMLEVRNGQLEVASLAGS